MDKRRTMHCAIHAGHAASTGKGFRAACACALLPRLLAMAACSGRLAVEPAAAPVLKANMVLNRTLFLSWTEAPGSGFGRYEVFAGPVSEGLPDRPTAVFEESDHCYFQSRGLQPGTE